MQVAYPLPMPKERAYRENRRHWLSLWAEEAGGPKRLAELSGTVDTHITAILKGRRNVGDDLAEKLERKLGKAEGLMDFPAPGAPQLADPSEYLPGFEQFSIPKLANAASMGPGTEVQPEDVVVGRLTLAPDWIAKTLKPLSAPQNLRFIHGYGDSMEPTFADGDVLLVDVGVRNPDIDGIYVLAANERLFIKRVTARFDGVPEITSDNPRVKTVQALDGSQAVEVLGRVLWAWNGKKL
jgi:phage repressor protein C with HTH and peptisase S24 domain